MMTLDEAIKNAEEVAEQNEWFDKNCLESMQCRECAKEHRQLAEWLKELKQLREQTRWIPVSSEGLPKTGGMYTVTRKIYDCPDMAPIIMSDESWFDGKNWHNDNRINYKRKYLTDVIAWMSLPEPYGVESEE